VKLLFDLLPVILFFGVFKWGEANPEHAYALASQWLSGLVATHSVSQGQAPILLATSVAIVATFVQILLQLVRGKKVDAMLWVSLAIITVFGGATIYFNNETFIKLKPTVLYWLFAAGMVVAKFGFQRNLIKTMMGKQLELPEPVWGRLLQAWVLFFGAMGVINLLVAYNFSTATWVSFKLFGFMGIMLAFIVGQSLMLSKYMKDAK
jgi:intracellular septation protein